MLLDSRLKKKKIFFFFVSKGQAAAFEELFVSACPKFLSPHLPSLSEVGSNVHLEPLRFQQSIFLSEVRQQGDPIALYFVVSPLFCCLLQR